MYFYFYSGKNKVNANERLIILAERQGRYTLILPSKPSIHGHAAVVGKAEGEGPMASEFDYCYSDDTIDGCPSWEKAESALQYEAITRAIAKAELSPKDIDLIMAGDLLDQCIGTSFGIRELEIPFLGLYGACSTMALSMALASVLVDSGAVNYAVASTSSHFASAERQFRLPLEYGGQRPPAAQRTATASGASVISANKKSAPCVEAVIFGKIMDLGIKDANNMGAAMAPAAADTLLNYFEASGTSPSDYDMVISGDLGKEGVLILGELLAASGVDASERLNDCGMMIYDLEAQDVHAGGSGCGCSAVVLASHLLPKLKSGELSNILIYGTGAMMSPSSLKQGLAIPAVAHLLHLRSPEAKCK